MSIRGGRWALVVALVVVGACTLKTEGIPGRQGDKGDPGGPGSKGDPGPKGDPGEPDSTELAKLQTRLDAVEQELAQRHVCGWFSPDHPVNCQYDCQNFSQLALDAGWKRCLPKPSTGLGKPYGRQFFNNAQCVQGSEVDDGTYAYWETRFGQLSGVENTSDPSGALYLKWFGCNDIAPTFWCCQ